MSRKTMEPLNGPTGEMECRVCGATHVPTRAPSGRYRRGTWHCRNGCSLPDRKEKPIRRTLKFPFDFERPHEGETRDQYVERLMKSLHEQLDFEVNMADGDWGTAMVDEVSDKVALSAGWSQA